MRSTITLDPDVDSNLRLLMQQRGISFKEAINSTLRRALILERPPASPFVQKAIGLTINPNFNLDKALALAAEFEDEELIRKYQLGK